MRTKVERTCKKTGQQKISINLSCPKVVLNANDCARFLDSMGKTSTVLAEKEGKMVTTSTERLSPVLLSSTPVSSTTSSHSSTSPSTNVSSSLLAATQTKICKNWTSSTSSVSVESSVTAQTEKSSTDSAQRDQDISVLSQVILKPPKKRRGMDKKFETVSNPLVFSNGDINHSVISTSEELSDADSVQQGTDSPPFLVPSHRGSLQKHSVEHLLQHQPRHSMSAINNQTLITRSCSHDSRSHISLLNDLSSLSPNSSLAISSSPTLEDYKGGSSFATHLYPEHFNTSQFSKIHSYSGHTSSVELPPSLTISHSVVSNKTMTESENFQELPEQMEPMNLSTSCKPALSVLPLQTPSFTDSQTADVSKIHLQLSLAISKDLTESSSLTCISKTPQENIFEAENIGSNKSGRKIPETVHSMPSLDSLCSELYSSTQTVCSVSNSDNDISNGRTVTCVSKTLETSADFDKLHNTISDISVEMLHKDTQASICLIGVESHAVEKPSENQVEQIICSRLEPSTQSHLTIPAAISPDALISKAPEFTQITCNEDLMKSIKETSNTVKTKTTKKNKVTPKKKTDIPMDEAACAVRMHRYSLTIEDIIANFVYIPEPVEEFSLTEEEEAAIRDQFEKEVDDASSSEKTDTHTFTDVSACANTTNKASQHNGYNMPSLDCNIVSTFKPLKKRPTSITRKNSTELHQDVQKTGENIDSILAFVANDCTDSVPAIDTYLNTDSKAKQQKKLKKSTGGMNSMEKGKWEKVKKNTLCNNIHAQNNNDSVGESNCPCTEIIIKKSVSDACEDSEIEDLEKTSKAKDIKKRQSTVRVSSEVDISTSTESIGEISEVKVESVLKRKAVDVKLKTSKKKKTDVKSAVVVTESVTSQTELFLDKETIGANHVETSDIGESIASTSGSSEQDTPVHEQESKDEITDTNPRIMDRENHDTGLESGGDDKPVRRYKKRLDFVKCEQCDHQARGRSALSRHLKKVHMLDIDMPFKCQHCGYGCTKMASLNRHLFTHGIYTCSRCSFVADDRIKLAEHTTEQHKDKVDVKMCKVCNRYIKCDLITIEQHTRECNGPTPFQCTECEKEFKYASSLRVHYHTHYPDQPKRFKCEQCDYRTNYKANLHKHHKNMHASKDRDIQCPECGKLFSTEDNMRRHRKVHTMVRPFACETCNKTFKTTGALKGHQLVHTATRPYLCNIPGCNRNFRTPKFLKSHQEEFHRLVPKKFFCSVEGCNYSFFKRSHLKRHAITHTGERNFHCTWPGCIKSFRHADNLKVHFRSHTNEKPVQCHLCDFKCKQKNALFWHKKRVHQVIDISVCPSRLVNKNKQSVIEDVQKTNTISDIDTTENIHTALPVAENASETVLDEPPVLSKITEVLPLVSKSDGSLFLSATNTNVVLSLESKTDDSLLLSAAKMNAEPLPSPATFEQTVKTPAEEQGPVDLYEFKSDDESEEKTPGSFRRDKNIMNVLAPLPPPPKELLRKNEIQEMKEREKKEKADKKEQERKAKAERKEQERNEKEEKRNLEKKAKAERKELELKEKIKIKEQEKKERIEKKELEKKDKLEKKELEKKEKMEKKQQERKEKIEKREQEKKEKEERKEQDKKVKTDKKLTVKTKEMEDSKDCEDTKSPVKTLPNSIKRRKSPAPASKDEPVADNRLCKRGRKKLQAVTVVKSHKPFHKMKDNDKIGTSSLRRKMVHIKKEESGKSSSSSSSQSLVSALSNKVKCVTLKRTLVRRCKQKMKLPPPKRKPSARIKAKNKSKEVKSKVVKAEAVTYSTMKGQKSTKPQLKRKYIRKKVASSPKEKEQTQEKIDTDDVRTNTDIINNITNSECSQAVSEEIKVPLKSCQDDTPSLSMRQPVSPASSEEIMLQGKASPYRDFSDDENLEEQIKTPDSCHSQVQAKCPDVLERCEINEELSSSEKDDNMDKNISHPAEDYSDDEVSNDIPLTPPRAPAPPPIESSEDELESEPEPTPFSVPGPNTPFSVPGPNTPFSIPPPTNLMQQHSVNSEETPISAVPSVPSMEMQGSVDMQHSLESVEMHPHGSVEMNHSHGSVEIHHPQASFEVPHSHSSVEIRPHNSIEISSHGSVEMVQSHGSVEMMCHRSMTESIPHSEQQVQTPESVMREISSNTMSEKYELPPSLQEQTQASEADKEYFDQYLKSLSAANNRAANGGLEPSPSGLQQLEAMVGKSHLDTKEISSKSPISCLPTSVITSLESSLPLLSHGDLRARLDVFVSDRHHESLYPRDTPSSLSRISDRQTPLPHSAMGHSPAFDAFSSLNSLHPASASSGRENTYLRQPENLFPTPPGTNSFMAEAMFQRQAMTTPFLTPQASDRSSLSRIPDASSLQSSSSSSLLRRSGTVAGPDMFSPPTMTQSIPRHPFANAWTSQEVRPTHWQTPYLSHQPNMGGAGTFFPSKDNYLTGRDFMFDPSIRPSTDRSMFPSLSSSQSQDSFQLDRFDLSNYFPNAMTPYGSSPSSLEYSRSAHVAAAKPFDNRYRQTATSATIPDFRGLPPSGSADMFSGLPGVNTSFNLYAGNPMSYHTQHMADNVNSAFLTHSTSAQHSLFERDYAAAAHRSLYPQNTPYPFVDERQYPGASKLAHAHSGASAVASQERDLVSRSAAPESQMQDPYRSLLYRY